ncbi:hypothetical protein ZIOFF_009396 [Zingiber officinale]|uniref:B box-type domain-containing protein n=1 Tax=Zingiber officinale TaxID=94328 RepID=A0A8J5LRF7_ZINOF|nr:hypothetical protein ZIOFF_009396 [Zingiber officinale]
MGRGAHGGGRAAVPGWLGRLVEESFFVGCGAHESRKKNEKNIFCLDCCSSICPHCAPAHSSHPLLQPYTINSAKVVFLKPRPQSRPPKGSGNICPSCDRILQEPFHFCSLSCKVEHVVSRGEDLSSILLRFNASDFAFSHFEDVGDGQFTPNSILEDPAPQYNGSESGGGGDGGFFPQINVLSLSSRRKGAPHRSPLS